MSLVRQDWRCQPWSESETGSDLGPNTGSRVGTKRSMSEEGVDKRAEMPERTRKVGGGTAEDTDPARQALPARGENAEAEARLLSWGGNRPRLPAWDFFLDLVTRHEVAAEESGYMMLTSSPGEPTE